MPTPTPIKTPIKQLFILGAGVWGSALAIALAKRCQSIYLYTHNPDKLLALNERKHHPRLNVSFADNITITHQLDDIKHAEAVLIATDSHNFDNALRSAKPYLTNQFIAWVTKGFHHDQQPLSVIFNTITGRIGCVISGPSFAQEVAADKPTALVVASTDENTRNYWSTIIQTPYLRSYQSADMIGVEVGGLVKNVLAIAAGIAAGLGYGANTQAALITRGLAEMIRLGHHLGADKKTFIGLSGLGDLVLSCSDNLSRNRCFGQYLASGLTTQASLAKVGSTVEGLQGVDVVNALAVKYNIDMPISQQVAAIINAEVSPKQAVDYLMARKPYNETP